MNLQEIEQSGGFISDEPVPAKITWKDKEYEIFVRRLSYGDVEALATADGSTKAAILGVSILLGAAKEPLTTAKALKLDPFLANKMLEAWGTVNESKNS